MTPLHFSVKVFDPGEKNSLFLQKELYLLIIN
jgi:hypothetical protein